MWEYSSREAKLDLQRYTPEVSKTWTIQSFPGTFSTKDISVKEGSQYTA